MSTYNRAFLSGMRSKISVALPTLLTLVGTALLPVSSPVAIAGGEECVFNPAVPGLRVASLNVSPSVVEGRSKPKGVVVLSGPAPQSGATITLGTNFYAANPGYCVVVPAGERSAEFSIFTYEQSMTSRGNIYASYGNSFLEAPLTVTPKN